MAGRTATLNVTLGTIPGAPPLEQEEADTVVLGLEGVVRDHLESLGFDSGGVAITSDVR